MTVIIDRVWFSVCGLGTQLYSSSICITISCIPC